MGNESIGARFSTTLPLTVYVRPADSLQGIPPLDIVGTSSAAWTVFDRGPGYFTIPEGMQAGVRIKGIDDHTLNVLTTELVDFQALALLNLAENRNITDAGMARIARLKQLVYLNLSSCDITAKGMTFIKDMPNLMYLDLSYCNRVNDAAIKDLRAIRNLAFINLQACFQITKAGMTKLDHRGLKIHY